MLLLGLDLGTSAVKATVLDAATGTVLAAAQYPDAENPILSLQPGWAEQSPDTWWEQVIAVIRRVNASGAYDPQQIAAIGIAYQMHGLVCVDGSGKVLRNSIIWCDSRAVPYGAKAFAAIGETTALSHLLNSPGNFTAAKLAWVKEQEPELYKHIHKIMLPGDFIAYRMTGTVTTTASALSEGIFWDFKEGSLSSDIMQAFGFESSLIPEIRDVFTSHGQLLAAVAGQTGLKAGIPITYKAGDQPNNAFSLNVLNPGEVAATAGTSGVVYGVSDKVNYDPKSRVNSFAHVNHTAVHERIGILLCVNGTGILNSWIRKNVFQMAGYDAINQAAATVSPGADGLLFYPFGNGAERVLENKNPGASLKGLDLNRHQQAHLARAAQEGIAFALQYGMEVMSDMGMTITTVRAGYANMFLSPVFSEVFCNTAGVNVELYNTDGATGAARAAGLGAGIFSKAADCYKGMTLLKAVEPTAALHQTYQQRYQNWKSSLEL